MRRMTLLLLFAVAITVAGVAIYLSLINLVGVLTIGTDKTVYQKGEMITFAVRNNGLSGLEFPNSGLGFRIMNSDTGQYVNLDRIYPAVIHYMPPLASETIKWDQTEFAPNGENLSDHQLVKPGNYVASVRTAGGFEPEGAGEVRFRIS